MMRLSEIRIHIPQTIEDAFKLLTELAEAAVAAGGTDLLVDLKQGLISAKNIVSLQNIRELRGIKLANDKIRLGALATPQEIIASSLIARHLPAFQDAARSMASRPIRAMATLGGNIASAVPSADLPPILIAADASCELRCAEERREILLSEFFVGPRKTACRYGEILTQVFIPLPPSLTGMSYQKFVLREANALAVASVAARLTLEDGKTGKAAVVLGAVAPTPLLAENASAFLIGKAPSPDVFEEAALMAREEARPISDIRGSAWFRKELLPVLVRRSLNEALGRAQKKSRPKD